MVTPLSSEYTAAGQPAVFFEQRVDSPLVDSSRKTNWYNAHGYTGITLPMVMVDSGNQFSNGPEDYREKYTAMVNSALERTPGAAITAIGSRVGNTLHFSVTVTNYSNVTLSSGNRARVYAMAYEEMEPDPYGTNPDVPGLTNNYLRASAWQTISSLTNGASQTFTLETADLTDVVWDKLHPVVFVEYRPSGSSASDMLQAALEITAPLNWQVTPGKTGNGSISPATAQTVADNGTASFTLTPQADNHIENVTGSCPAGTLAGNQYTTGPIIADCTVTAVFAENTSNSTVLPPLQLLLLNN